ncbi:MAG: hypothetical protein V4682_02730 [Patescibacteria group bacterium]
MTTRRIFLAALFPLLLCMVTAVPSAHAADFTISVENVTMVPLPPKCEARATKRSIRSGGSVDIVWKSNAEKMIGLTKGEAEWPADGRQRVAIAVRGKHVFPLTFVGKNGATRTCTATVFVHAKK